MKHVNGTHAHLERSLRASGRGPAPARTESNHSRGSRRGTTTKGFMSLFATSFVDCTTLSTPCSSATPHSRDLLPRPQHAPASRGTPDHACGDRVASTARRRNPAPPLIDNGAERKESVGPRDKSPTATARMVASFRESTPCPCRWPLLSMVDSIVSPQQP